MIETRLGEHHPLMAYRKMPALSTEIYVIIWEIQNYTEKKISNILEAVKNGKRNIRRQTIVSRILSGDRVRNRHDMVNSHDRPGGRGSDTGYDSVLQRKPSKPVGSKAFRNVIENIFGIQTQGGNGKRTNVANRIVGRSISESAGESSGRIYKTTGRNETHGGQGTGSKSSRRVYAENVRAVQGTEVREQDGLSCEFVKSEYYTDDMRAIEENNRKQGVGNTYFFLDSGKCVQSPSVNFRGAGTETS